MPETIKLAGKEIEVLELPIRKNRAWRERARIPLSAQQELGVDAEKADNPAAVADLYQRYVAMVTEHSELILELVLDYLPDQSEREYYAENATEPEVLHAFIALVRLSFSTGFFIALTGAALLSGSAGPATGMSSPDPSGASGSTN